MNGFKKLVLTSAILAASSSAFAMQALDDESLSATTGQDGLSINIDSSVIEDMGIKWIDRNGITAADFAGSTFTGAGAVVINHVGVEITDLNIAIDAGSSAADNGQLNIGINTTNNIVINLNDGDADGDGTALGTTIGVTSAGATGSTTGVETPIIAFNATSALTISGGISANIKLGNRGAGEHFMTLDFASPVDITLTGLSILDSVGTAANALDGDNVGIGVGSLIINDLDVSAAVNVVAAGLQINTAGTTIGEVGLERVVLGDLGTTSPSIGDIYLTGLDVSSTITVAGKN